MKMLFLQVLAVMLFAKHIITPIPLNPVYDEQKALLGKQLFIEKKLSPDKNLACTSCHKLSFFGVDNKANSTLNSNETTAFNAPTVFNAVFNHKNFWDGRATTLEEQLNDSFKSFITTEDEKKAFMDSLAPLYEKNFKKIYKDGFVFKNLINALVEFQKALTTPNAPFDKYLRGDKSALTYSEIRGYEVFKESGCIACHNGINIGSNSFSKLTFNNDKKNINKGCYGKKKSSKETYFIKVPSLRNVVITAPYFHNGQITKIQDAIQEASMLTLKRKLSTNEIDSIIEFLKTLTGEKPKILKDSFDGK